MRQREKRFLVRLQFQQSPDGGQPVALRIVVHDELRVPALARLDRQIAHDRREMPRLVRERKGRQRVERLKNVALARNQRAAERGIEEIFLHDAPGDQFFAIARRPCGGTGAA